MTFLSIYTEGSLSGGFQEKAAIRVHLLEINYFCFKFFKTKKYIMVNQLAIFEQKPIRKVEHNGEMYFSIVDIIENLRQRVEQDRRVKVCLMKII